MQVMMDPRTQVAGRIKTLRQHADALDYIIQCLPPVDAGPLPPGVGELVQTLLYAGINNPNIAYMEPRVSRSYDR